MKKICFVLFCLVFLCCGCQDTPQEVKERMKSYGDNEQIDLKKINYCTVQELKDTSISNIDVKLDNMELPAKIDFSGIEGIAVLNISFEDKFSEKQNQFLELFNIDKKSLVGESVTAAGKSLTYDSLDDKKYFVIEDNGFMSYMSDMTYDLINSDVQQKIIENYDVYTDGVTQKTVKLGADNTDISQTCKNTENWLDANMPIEKCIYRISDVYVRELQFSDEAEKQLSLFAQVQYKGISFNNYGVETEFTGTNGKVSLMTYGINLNYEGINKMTFFSNGTGGLKIDSEKEVTKVIDLESAIKLVNEKISGFNKLSISEILPLYALYPEYADDTAFSSPGQIVEGRPVYAFIIHAGEDDSELGIAKSNSCKFIFVDMINGDIKTNIG